MPTPKYSPIKTVPLRQRNSANACVSLLPHSYSSGRTITGAAFCICFLIIFLSYTSCCFAFSYSPVEISSPACFPLIDLHAKLSFLNIPRPRIQANRVFSSLFVQGRAGHAPAASSLRLYCYKQGVCAKKLPNVKIYFPAKSSIL